MGATIRLKTGDHDDYDLVVERAGSGVSLAAAQLTFRARRAKDATVLVEKTIGEGITVVDAPNGVAVLQFVPEDTSEYEQRIDLRYELELVESSGRVTTIAAGVLQIRPDLD